MLILLPTLAWAGLAFLAGALPFSIWIGRWALRTDIRRYGDHNPGATNVLRAGGWRWGLPAFLLDYLKGALPVGAAHLAVGLTGWPLVVVALAPVLGHAFSPFLGFRGGKAVAATFGIWTGLTIWEGPTIMGLCLGLAYWLLEGDGWAVLLALGGLMGYLAVTPPTANLLGLRPDLVPTLLAVGVGNGLLLAWKHREDLSHPPRLRPWLGKRLAGLFRGRGK